MNISIKNFRIIGQEGFDLRFAPVTFLTGCNSSGKSSITKAILLLNNYLKDLKENNYNLIGTPLDFSEFIKLGSFDSVLNDEARNKGNDNISLAYSFSNGVFTSPLKAEFIFNRKGNDSLNNGWLEKIVISVNNRKLFSIKVKNKSYQINLFDQKLLIEYFNLYIIKQLISAKHKAEEKIINSKYEELNDKTDEFYEIIDSLDLNKIVLLNDTFVKKNKISKDITYSNFNPFILKDFSQNEVLGIEENILEVKKIDLLINRLEKQKNKKITFDEKDLIIKELWAQRKSLLNKNIDASVIKRFYDKFLISSKEYIDKYISSESNNIIEFLRSKQESVINSIIDEFNSEDKDWVSNQFNYNLIEFLKGNTLINRRLLEFIASILEKAFNPDFMGRIHYIESSTFDVKRLYALDDRDRFGNLIKEYNSLKKLNNENRIQDNNGIGTFIKKWLKEFNIASDFFIENIEGAIRVNLIDESFPQGRLLSDFGFGVTKLFSLLIHIEIAIHKPFYIPEWFVNDPILIGNGVVQPFYVENNYYLIVEEPEVNLHPRLQSKLTDMFLDAAQKGVRIIIETHSEYMIRRSQVIVAEKFKEKSDYKPDFKVYYCPGQQPPYDMTYLSTGRFEKNFGEGFFDEAASLALTISKLERQKNHE